MQNTVMVFSDYAGTIVLWIGAILVAMRTDSFDRKRESDLIKILVTRSVSDDQFKFAQDVFADVGYQVVPMSDHDKLELAYTRLVEQLTHHADPLV